MPKKKPPPKPSLVLASTLEVATAYRDRHDLDAEVDILSVETVDNIPKGTVVAMTGVADTGEIWDALNRFVTREQFGELKEWRP